MQGTYDLKGWVQITCAATEAVMCAAPGYITVFSTITDPDGLYGPALNYTEWGIKSEDQPLLRTYIWPQDDDKPCEHWINTKANVAAQAEAEKEGDDD